MRFTEV